MSEAKLCVECPDCCNWFPQDEGIVFKGRMAEPAKIASVGEHCLRFCCAAHLVNYVIKLHGLEHMFKQL